MMVNERHGVRIPVKRNGNQVTEPQSEDDNPQILEDGVDIVDAVDALPVAPDAECIEWRDTALRLKADMINYRKRQARWAQDEVQRERDRLLLGFVGVLDDMEQAMEHIDPKNTIHQPVQIAYNNMQKLLLLDNVERIDAAGAPFDPQWHDAVVMVPAPNSQRDAMVVKEVVANGYRIGGRLLKPARVVVSKRS